jgi:aspartate-semialdehyde dehydrogenase
MTTVGVAGGTGLVGRTILAILAERAFPVDELRVFASARSAGNKLETEWGEVEVEDLAEADPLGIDLALFSAGGERSRAHAGRFIEQGAVVVDNSSTFRMNPEVPLVLVGVNDADLDGHRGLVANPNCTTINLVMAAAPLHRRAGLRKVVASSYQSVSGSGQRGMDELRRQVAALGADHEALLAGGWNDPGSEVYARPIGWNVVPFAGTEDEGGYLRASAGGGGARRLSLPVVRAAGQQRGGRRGAAGCPWGGAVGGGDPHSSRLGRPG